MRIHFIGETIKSIPFSLKKNYKKVGWRKFARLRNIIGWDVLKVLSELKVQIKEILENEGS
ncbi:hypothetical protein J4462_05050 [Candidatus Pacearchaeota archaeon]|nr:hypothetical protein [Candidatus Pacearchaeota archaeon]